jgi:hypothetical protein
MCPVCVANAALIEAAHCALDQICVTSNDAFKQIGAVDPFDGCEYCDGPHCAGCRFRID